MQTELNSPRRWLAQDWLSQEWVFLVVITGLAITRLLWLDADANRFKRVGDIGDESWWWNAARSQVLFGEWLIPEDDNAFGLWSGPLYVGLDFLFLQAGGPNYYTGRLPSALSSLLLLGIVYFVVRKDYGRPAALAALLLLGLNVHFYNYNRLGLIETIRLVLIVVSLLLWQTETKRPYALAALSGLLAAGAMLTKVRPDFIFYPAALWLLDWLQGRLNWKRLAVFAAPLGLATLGLGLYVLTHWSQLAESIALQMQISRVTHWSVPSYLPFLPFAIVTNAVFRLFPVLLLYFCAWPVFAADLGKLIEAPKQFIRSLRQTDVLGLALLIGTLLCGLVYDYGDRRMFPLIIPLTFFAARNFAQPVLSLSIPPFTASRRLVAGPLAAVGVLWLSWWKSTTTIPWPDGSARWFLSWALAVAAVGAGLAALYFIYCTTGQRNGRVLVGALALTHLLILVDLSAAELAHQFLSPNPPRWAATVLALAVSLAFLTVYFLKGNVPLKAAWRWVSGGAAAAFGIAVIGAQLIWPTFTNRDASRTLNQFARPGEIVLTENSYDICIETRAKCLLWTANADANVWRFNRDQATFSSRKFWWVFREDAARYYNPAVSPCAYDSTGVVLGALTPLGSFQLIRGTEDWNMELYEIGDPVEQACPLRQDQ